MSYQHQELTRQIIGAAIEVHKILGPGLLESAYRQCLVFELEERGVRCNQELLIPILYKHRGNCKTPFGVQKRPFSAGSDSCGTPKAQ